MIDLNSATVAELMTLHEVDESRAYDLTLWRPYLSWSEVENVPGITPDLIARWQAGERDLAAMENDALQALRAGRVDAMVNERFYSLEALKTAKGKLQQGDLLFQEKLGLAVAKGNSTLLKGVNGALKTVQGNGTYTKISKSYFGQDIRCR